MNVYIFLYISFGIISVVAIIWLALVFADWKRNDCMLAEKEDRAMDELLREYYLKKRCDMCKEKRNAKKK